MLKILWNRVGRQTAHAVAAGHFQGSRLNMKLGFALLRDRRISFWAKLVSLALGIGLAGALVSLEISPEMILAAILPGLGLAMDLVTDGLEAVIMPFVFGALLLPFIAPRAVVEQIMMERAGVGAPPLPAPRLI